MTDWTISWRGRKWTDSDLTGQHLATLALLSGDDRFADLSISEDEIAEYPQQGYMRLMNMIGALTAVDATKDIDDPDEAEAALLKSLEHIQRASAEEILGALSFG